MSKQDRQGVRTPADIERKYNLGDLENQAKQGSEKLNQLTQAFSQFIASVNGKIAELQTEVVALRSAYSVGSVFVSLNPENPSIMFGGEWELVATGNLLVGLESEALPELLQTPDTCYIWKRIS